MTKINKKKLNSLKEFGDFKYDIDKDAILINKGTGWKVISDKNMKEIVYSIDVKPSEFKQIIIDNFETFSKNAEKQQKQQQKDAEKQRKQQQKAAEKQRKAAEKQPLSIEELEQIIIDKYKDRIKFNETKNIIEFDGKWMYKNIYSIIENQIEVDIYPKKFKISTLKSAIENVAKNNSYKIESTENVSWRNKLEGIYTKSGEFIPDDIPNNYKLCIENLMTDWEITHNSFFNETCVNGKILDENLLSDLSYELGNQYRGKLRTNEYKTAALHKIAINHEYDPFTDKLNALVWDGEERLENVIVDWFKTLPKYESEYKKWTKKIFVAQIARIFKPGCAWQSMPIIITEGGTGKDLFVKTYWSFFDDGNNTYYADCSFEKPDDKDTIQLLQQNLLINFTEMKGFVNKDNATTKAFMTRAKDSARFSYRKDVQEYPRHCIFWGSTNCRTLFNDYTSPHERRFLPFESTLHEGENLDYIDIFMDDGYRTKEYTEEEFKNAKYHVEQVWAEAMYLYKTKFNYGTNDIDKNIIAEMQTRYATTEVNTNFENIHIALNTFFEFDSFEKKTGFGIFGSYQTFYNQINVDNVKRKNDEWYLKNSEKPTKKRNISLKPLQKLPLNWLKKAFNEHSNDNNYYLKLLGDDWKIEYGYYNGCKKKSKMIIRTTPICNDNFLIDNNL